MAQEFEEINLDGEIVRIPAGMTDEEASAFIATIPPPEQTANGGGSPLAESGGLSTAPGQQVTPEAPSAFSQGASKIASLFEQGGFLGPSEVNANIAEKAGPELAEAFATPAEAITLPTASGKDALLDPGGVIAESALKGASGLARGVLTFPEDVVRGLAGDDVSEADIFKNPFLGLTKVIGDIGRKIPQFKGGSTLGDIGSDIAQFAAPLGPVGKGVRAVVPGKGNALANLVGTSLSDVVVADPTQDQSILESLGVTRELSPLESRTTIGAEGGAVGGTLSTGAALFRSLGRGLRPFTEKGLEKQVAESLQESTTKPVGEVIEDIDAGLKRQEPKGFKPTTGTLTADEGLIGFEKGVAPEPELVNRAIKNREALSQEVQTTLQAGGDPTDLKNLAEDIVNRKIEAGESSVKNAETLQAEAKAEVDELADSIQGTAGARGAASEKLSGELQTELNRRTLIKNQKFDNIDPQGVEPIDRQSVVNLVDSFTPTSKGDVSGQEFLNSRVAKRLKALTEKSRTVKVPGSGDPTLGTQKAPTTRTESVPPTFQEINDLRATVSADIVVARKAGKGDQVKKLEDVRAFINNQADVLAQRGGDAGDRAQDALTFFKEDFAPFFGSGAGKKFRGQARNFEVEPTKTASTFLRPSTRAGGAKESSEQLANIIQNTPDSRAGTQAVRDFIVEDLGASLAGKNPEQVLKTVRSFMKTNADNLNTFPQVAKEIEDFANGLEGGLSRVNKLGDEVLDVQKAVKETNKKVEKSAFAKLAKSDDPVKTIDGILKSNTGKTDFDRLFVSTQGNKAARDGLKASLSESLTDRIVNTVKSVEGEVSPSQLNKVLKDKNIQNALNKTYKKSEIADLKRVQDRIRETERINTQVTNTSQTAGLTISSQRIANLFASVYGIAKGRGLFTISKIISEAIGGNPSEKMKRIVARSMIDPEFAKMLLSKKVGDSNKEARRVALYTINNIFTDERDTEDQ